MPCIDAYYGIDQRHEARIARLDAADDWEEVRSAEITDRWWAEYMATGRIGALDWDEDEMTAIALERGIASHKALVSAEASKLVAEAVSDYSRFRMNNPNYLTEILGADYEH